MDNLHKGCLFKVIKEILKFLLVYYVFGMVALCAICVSSSISLVLDNNSSQTIISMIENGSDGYAIVKRLIEEVTSSVPLSGLFELLSEDEGNIFSGLFEFFQNLFDKETVVPALKTYLPKLFRDVTVMALSSLIFFIFSRFNKLLSILKLKGFSGGLAFYIVSVLWYFASYCCSNCFLKIIEYRSVLNNNIIYILIILISTLIHGLLLGLSVGNGESRVPRALVILAIELPFCAFNALLLWLLKSTLYDLFNIFNGSALLIFVLVAFCLKLLTDLESSILSKATFKLFTLFQKNGKAF